jgi:hypothetical protein
MKKLTKIEKLAFELLKTLEKKRDEYWKINRLLRKQSDFMGLEHCNSELEGAMVKLVDEILGYELGSYYLYERPSKGGCIILDDVEYPIENIKQLITYYRAQK